MDSTATTHFPNGYIRILVVHFVSNSMRRGGIGTCDESGRRSRGLSLWGKQKEQVQNRGLGMEWKAQAGGRSWRAGPNGQLCAGPFSHYKSADFTRTPGSVAVRSKIAIPDVQSGNVQRSGGKRCDDEEREPTASPCALACKHSNSPSSACRRHQ